MRAPIGLIAMSLLASSAFAADQPAKLGSTVFTWETREAKPTGVGEYRGVARNPTATLKEFECHITCLNAGNASHAPHIHPQEELIILREGTLDVHINGVETRVGPGSLFFFASYDWHAVKNVGDTQAKYFVFNFSSAATAAFKEKLPLPPAPGRMGSAIWNWNDLKVVATKTGERRAVVDSPTSTLDNFECHVTTINAGLAPHAPHRHPDEEIVLVAEGELDVTLNGVTTRATPGSIVFVSSNDEHGWKNAGDTPATYYVMRVKSESTPAATVAME
jgi:quercetin dioxygenase-like cupin family protein